MHIYIYYIYVDMLHVCTFKIIYIKFTLKMCKFEGIEGESMR